MKELPEKELPETEPCLYIKTGLYSSDDFRELAEMLDAMQERGDDCVVRIKEENRKLYQEVKV